MFQNKKILVLGAARSGISCASKLIELNNEVILNDLKETDNLEITKLKEKGVKCILGSHPDDLLDSSFDYVIKNPGIRNDHKYVMLAKKLNIPVINEVEFAYHLLPKVKLIAITGTNGKTTTTTLTYNILKEEYGSRVKLAGNIGYPLTSVVDTLKDDDILVMEISCQQLANLDTFKPDIALLTNLSPAHIDFFGDYETYQDVKLKLFKNQTSKDLAILNLDNYDSMKKTSNLKAKRMYFSVKEKADASYVNSNLMYQDEVIMPRNKMFLKGDHNVSNALASIIICKELGVKNETICKVLENFRGVEHRLELVDVINNRKFYNDTEATNIKCTQIALNAFTEPTIIFLGGLERGQDFNELKPFMKNVKLILGIGQCRKRVLEFGNSLGIKTIIHEHLNEAFYDAYKSSASGDVILLSPASASWDQYKECEERGAEFKKLVEGLK